MYLTGRGFCFHRGQGFGLLSAQEGLLPFGRGVREAVTVAVKLTEGLILESGQDLVQVMVGGLLEEATPCLWVNGSDDPGEVFIKFCVEAAGDPSCASCASALFHLSGFAGWLGGEQLFSCLGAGESYFPSSMASSLDSRNPTGAHAYPSLLSGAIPCGGLPVSRLGPWPAMSCAGRISLSLMGLGACLHRISQPWGWSEPAINLEIYGRRGGGTDDRPMATDGLHVWQVAFL